MSDDYTLKNWVPSVTATRAGGMDFQKVQESRKWAEMIKQERGIEMSNMMAHIRKWHGEGHLKGYSIGERLDAEEKSGLFKNNPKKSKLWFPTMGLGAEIPKSVQTIEPQNFVKMVSTSDFGTRRFGQTNSLSLRNASKSKSMASLHSSSENSTSDFSEIQNSDGFANMPGEPLTSKQLVSRMRKMQEELRKVRTQRKNAQTTLRKLTGSSRNSRRSRKSSRAKGSAHRKKALENSEPLSSRRSSRRSSKSSIAHDLPLSRPLSQSPSIASSKDSLLERISDSGRFDTSRASTALPSARTSSRRSSRHSSRPVSRVNKRVFRWNSVLQLWEHRDLSLPKGSRLLNKRDTYHSNNIAALFADPRTPGRSTSKDTLAPTADLVRMGLLDELSAKQMQLWTVSPKMRHPRVMSKLTAFAEHAVKNKLKPFAVGRG